MKPALEVIEHYPVHVRCIRQDGSEFVRQSQPADLLELEPVDTELLWERPSRLHIPRNRPPIAFKYPTWILWAAFCVALLVALAAGAL